MTQAYAAAQHSFKFFWRELSWERRRIVPALDMAMIKLPFTDGPRSDGKPEFEHMPSQRSSDAGQVTLRNIGSEGIVQSTCDHGRQFAVGADIRLQIVAGDRVQAGRPGERAPIPSGEAPSRTHRLSIQITWHRPGLGSTVPARTPIEWPYRATSFVVSHPAAVTAVRVTFRSLSDVSPPARCGSPAMGTAVLPRCRNVSCWQACQVGESRIGELGGVQVQPL